jgi:uncharacterized protein YndB with AHSA1/START domain
VAREVKHSVFIRATPLVVYDVFATAAGLDSWFTTGAEIDARRGGRIVYRWKDWGPEHITTDAVGQVHDVDPPNRFVFDWDSADEQPTTVEMHFEAVDGGTVMRLGEFGFSEGARGEQALAREAAGWGEAMTLAKFRVEYGVRY